MSTVRPQGLRHFVAAAVVAIAGLAAGSVAATEDVDVERGLTISRTWCTSCHMVEPGGAAVDAGPPFAEVANDPNKTEDALRAWLADPHPPMPDLNLGRDEIRAILAYLDSLKGPVGPRSPARSGGVKVIKARKGSNMASAMASLTA